jgi:Arm DNA-binding domain
VAALVKPTSKADHIEWDDELPGFGVRLRGETKRWIVQYRLGPQQRRESLGDVRKVGLEDARKIARQRFAKVELGVDPAAEKARTLAQAASAKLTLAAGAERYLAAKKDMLRPRSYNAANLHFTVHWKPLRERPIDAIKRADVAARLQEITTAHGGCAGTGQSIRVLHLGDERGAVRIQPGYRHQRSGSRDHAARPCASR